MPLTHGAGVSLIVIEPSEIRFWATKRSSIGQLAEIAKGAVTGETAAPARRPARPQRRGAGAGAFAGERLIGTISRIRTV